VRTCAHVYTTNLTIRITTLMQIHETTNLLLSNLDRTGTWLRITDQYIQAHNKDPKSFSLPKSYALLQPLIEAYANNPEGFLYYVRGIRDSIEKDSAAYAEVHTVFRRLNGRLTQQMRRERSQRAVEKAEDLYGPTGYHDRMQWVSQLEHSWAKRRISFLSMASGGVRLSLDERTELLIEFWDEIDTEINNGRRLPKWN